MRKSVIAIIAACVLLSVDASAQHDYVARDIRPIEFEIGAGLATAANRVSAFGKARQGVDGNIELRYNFDFQPVDLGLYVSVCTFSRGEQTGDYANSYDFVSENLLVTSDYNFFRGNNVSPFVGLGLGVAWSDINADGSRKGTHFAVMPRVGVELSHHLRITLAYKIFERANNHLTLSLGYAFGGGRR